MMVALPVVATFCIPNPVLPRHSRIPARQAQSAESLRSLGDRFERRHLDRAAGDAPRLGGIVLEEIAALQGRLAGVLVHGGDMEIVRAVARLHAAIADLAPERGIGVDRRDERADLAVPI